MMKTMLSVVLLLFIVSSCAVAQITFTRADIESELVSGSMTSYEATGVEGQTFNLGSPGSGKSWDISGYSYSAETMNIVYVNPADTDYGDEFPTATHASISSIDGESASLYLRLDDQGLYMQGVGSLVQQVPLIIKHDPEMPEMIFPTALGSSWNYNGKPIEPIEGVVMQTRAHEQAISSGTLLYPGGSAECLLLKRTAYETSKVEFGGTVISEEIIRSVDYSFMSKQKVSATLSVDTLDESSEAPRIWGLSYALRGTATNVDAWDGVENFSLDQNYPNPVTARSAWNTNISFNLDRTETISLRIYDMNGREVTQVEARSLPSGHHIISYDASQLGTGSYIIQLRTAHGSLQRLMSVVK